MQAEQGRRELLVLHANLEQTYTGRLELTCLSDVGEAEAAEIKHVAD